VANFDTSEKIKKLLNFNKSELAKCLKTVQDWYCPYVDAEHSKKPFPGPGPKSLERIYDIYSIRNADYNERTQQLSLEMVNFKREFTMKGDGSQDYV
jgi:hypothetical protein